MDTEGTENMVFVGKKPTMKYVFSVSTQSREQTEIHVKARGRSISKAVDVALISTHRFLTDWEISNTVLETDERKSEGQDKEERVSCIDIILKKK